MRCDDEGGKRSAVASRLLPAEGTVNLPSRAREFSGASVVSSAVFLEAGVVSEDGKKGSLVIIAV
uniref:Uncharacterized protein n=1 Tax=Setaria digitata TaxID=48799 RepID=A0A915PKJ5_9BILA